MEWLRLEPSETCCFTGHRPDKLPSGYRREEQVLAPLRAALRQAAFSAAADGFRTFLCGMALGADTLAAEETLALRREGLPIRLIAALPCRGQEMRWPAADRERYRRLLEQADDVQVMCGRYTAYCMNARNRWMVENAGRVIAVFDGSPGGTANTVEMARRFGREIVIIPPFPDK